MRPFLTKTWIFSFLLTSLICYSVLLYHIISLKSSLDFVLLYHFAHNFITSQDLYAPIPWKAYYFPKGLFPAAQLNSMISGELSKTFSANLNPPSFAFFIFPFGFLPYRMAFLVWSILNFLMGVFGVYFIWKNLFPFNKDKQSYFIFLGIFFASIVGFSNISLGEMGVATFLCIVGIWVLARNKHDIPAGVLLGLLLSDKYTFGLLAILFLCQRRWKIVLSACAFFIFLNGLAYVVIGKESFIRYVDVLHHIGWYASNWNASLIGWIARFNLPRYLHFFSPHWFGFYFYGVCAFLFFLSFIKKSLSSCYTKNDYDYLFCYALLIGFILSPLSWIYYLNILLLPAALLIRLFASQKNNSLNLIFFISFSFGLLLYPNSLDVSLIHPFLDRIGQDAFHFYGLLCFFILWWYYEKYLRNFKENSEMQITPWVVLSYLLTIPSLIFLVYIVFFRVPRVWV